MADRMGTYIVQQCPDVVGFCWIRGPNASASNIDPLLFTQCLKDRLLEAVVSCLRDNRSFIDHSRILYCRRRHREGEFLSSKMK